MNDSLVNCKPPLADKQSLSNSCCL